MSRGVDRERVARYVIDRRGRLGLTQEELADRAGLDRKTIYHLESAERWPQVKTRGALEEALGWASGDLVRIGEGGEPTPTQYVYDDDRATAVDGAPGESEQAASRRHLQALDGGNEPLPPRDFGLGDEPPFPGKTHNAHGLNTPEILNEVWAMAKELEARLNEERGPQRDRKQRAIEQYKLAAQTLAAELNDAS